jgi:hypothetical protein
MTTKQVQATNQILEHVYRAHDALVDLRRHGISAEGVLKKPAFQISALRGAVGSDCDHREHEMGAHRVTSESDIVEPLRAQAADVPIPLALDAAVEIERLRTALQKIAYPGEMIVKAVVKIARAALKGQP